MLLLEGGDLRPEVFDLPFGLDAGPLPLLQRVGPRGDLLLGRLQRRGTPSKVAPEALHLLLQALDQGAGRLHALRETRPPGPWGPRVMIASPVLPSTPRWWKG